MATVEIRPVATDEEAAISTRPAAIAAAEEARRIAAWRFSG